MQKKKFFIMVGASLVLITLSVQTLAQRTSVFTFPDVPQESSFHDAIRHYVLLGIIQGYESGLFGPDDFLTRAQAILLLQRYESRLIAPLHKQMQEVRAALSLGTCGDSVRGTGEECDDGNTKEGDGCSSQCLTESFIGGCADGHAFGDQYVSSDGCNTCVCTREGVACTKMACLTCDPIVCTDGTEHPSCDNDGMPMSYLYDPCTDFESTEPEPIPLPKVTSSDRPFCGNKICEVRENEIPPDRRFHCPMDCTGQEAVRHCEEKKKEFFDLAENYKSCTSTEDCRKVEQSCPYLTCGVSINKSGVPSLTLKMNDVIDTCRKEGDITQCALCVYSAAVCEQGQCVLKGVGK